MLLLSTKGYSFLPAVFRHPSLQWVMSYSLSFFPLSVQHPSCFYYFVHLSLVPRRTFFPVMRVVCLASLRSFGPFIHVRDSFHLVWNILPFAKNYYLLSVFLAFVHAGLSSFICFLSCSSFPWLCPHFFLLKFLFSSFCFFFPLLAFLDFFLLFSLYFIFLFFWFSLLFMFSSRFVSHFSSIFSFFSSAFQLSLSLFFLSFLAS